MCNPFSSYYDDHYKIGSFCHHYTSFENGMKILNGNSFKASISTNTNDLIEGKPDFEIIGGMEEDIKRCMQAMHSVSGHVQTLSFSLDSRHNKKITRPSKDSDEYYTEKTYRGFSNQKQWDLYGQKNQGLCLVCGRKKLTKVVTECPHSVILKAGRINYENRLRPYKMPIEAINSLCLPNMKPDEIGAIASAKFLEANKEYVNHKYFMKNECWADENEYRYVLISDSVSPLFIPNIVDCIDGIVVGERATNENVKSLLHLIEDIYKANYITKIIPVMKIDIGSNGVYLDEMRLN